MYTLSSCFRDPTAGARPSIRLNAFSTPLSSTTAITKGWPISAAWRSAASIIALASAVDTLGRSNVAAIGCSLSVAQAA